MNITTLDTNKIRDCMDAMDSDVTKLVVKNHLVKAFENAGCKDDCDYEIHQGYVDFAICVYAYIEGDELYDYITTNKNSSVGIESITCTENKEFILTDYDVTLRIVVNFKCDLPEDDLNTLKMLGKVHDELVPAHINSSVYCEV